MDDPTHPTHPTQWSPVAAQLAELERSLREELCERVQLERQILRLRAELQRRGRLLRTEQAGLLDRYAELRRARPS